LSDTSGASPPSAPPTVQPHAPVWDAALKPAQRRAELARAPLGERALADARRERLVAAWLRELAKR
jgi:hypothetical protein